MGLTACLQALIAKLLKWRVDPPGGSGFEKMSISSIPTFLARRDGSIDGAQSQFAIVGRKVTKMGCNPFFGPGGSGFEKMSIFSIPTFLTFQDLSFEWRNDGSIFKNGRVRNLCGWKWYFFVIFRFSPFFGPVFVLIRVFSIPTFLTFRDLSFEWSNDGSIFKNGRVWKVREKKLLFWYFVDVSGFAHFGLFLAKIIFYYGRFWDGGYHLWRLVTLLSSGWISMTKKRIFIILPEESISAIKTLVIGKGKKKILTHEEFFGTLVTFLQRHTLKLIVDYR